MYTEYKIRDLIDGLIEVRSIEIGGFGVLYFGFDNSIHLNVIVKTVKKDIWEQYHLENVFQKSTILKSIPFQLFSSINRLSSFEEYLLYTFFREGILYMQMCGRGGFPAAHKIWKTQYGQPFLEIEEIKGINLKKFMKNHGGRGNHHRLAILEMLHIAVSFCNSMIYITENVIPIYNENHKDDNVNGFVHRDIKPDHILLTHHNEIKIIDFGTAKFSASNNVTGMVPKSRKIGTEPYCSPEQHLHFEYVDHKADIYSFGATLYFLSTGKELPQAVRMKDTDIPAILDIPPELDKIIHKCLEYDPGRRYQDFSELKRDISEILSRIKNGSIRVRENFKCIQCGFVLNKYGPVQIDPTLKSIRFKCVPAGQFIKGFTPLQLAGILKKFPKVYYDNDFLKGFPETKGYTEEYEISVTPITNEQYHQFLKDSGYKSVPDEWNINESAPYGKTRGNHPVVNVSYLDALEYCKFYGYRMPTGDEWEKAARGPDGLLYPWGGKFDKSRCNGAEAEIGDTTEVDQFPSGASPYGCLQMVGNVSEWVDQSHPEDKNYKYIVGGCFGDTCELFGLPLLRDIALNIQDRKDHVGFRVARNREVRTTEIGIVTGVTEKCPLCNGDIEQFKPASINLPGDRITNLNWPGFF
jgi:serine/threonine protein kinase